jgi:methionyl-tRNA formyltransferase
VVRPLAAFGCPEAAVTHDDEALAPLPANARRVAYLGTPAIAVPSLDALVDAGIEVAAVITGPDRRRGRGSATSVTPVKARARELGLEVHHDLAVIDDLGVDLAVVVAFGTIIPSDLLARVPMVNVHFSLLPRWRGAAPVERAILAGDDRTGVCVMQVETGLDTGGVLACVGLPLDDDVTAADLSGQLAVTGAQLLAETLSGVLPVPVAQVGEPVYAHKLTPADVALLWDLPAMDLVRRVRVGGAWTTFRGRRLEVVAAVAHPPGDTDPAPGVLSGQAVGTGDGTLELVTVLPEGRARTDVTSWLNGARPQPGERLGDGDDHRG